MDSKEELRIQQELLVTAEKNVELLEKSYQIKASSRRLAKESILASYNNSLDEGLILERKNFYLLFF